MKTIITASLLLCACVDEQNLGTSTHDIFTRTRWAITLGGIEGDDAFGVVIDSAGDAIATGNFTGTVSFGNETFTTTGHTAAYVTKRAGADGSDRWTIPIGTELDASVYATDLVLGPDDSLFVTGNFAGNLRIGDRVLHGPALMQASDCFIAKLDPGGHPMWLRSIGVASLCNGNTIAVGVDGRVAMAGAYQGTLVFPNGTFTATDHDSFLAVFDPDGNLVWGSVGDKGTTANSVAMTAEDDVVISGDIIDYTVYNGTLMVANARNSQYVARWTVDGHLLWAGQIGNAGMSQWAGPMAIDPSGTMVLSATLRPDGDVVYDNGKPLLTALDPTGHGKWTATATSGSAGATVLARLAHGTVVVGGATNGFPLDFGSGALENSYVFGAYKSNGALVDAIGFGDRYSSGIPLELASGPGSLAFVGWTRDPVDFGTGTLRYAGGSDALIVMLDTAE